MQENNYGNSTSIMLTLGVSEETKEVEFWHSKNVFMIGIGAGILIFILFLCLCCCFADSLTCFKTSDNACLKCLSGSDRLNEHDTSTYKKAPLDGSDGSTLINQPFQGFNQEINSKNFLWNSISGIKMLVFYFSIINIINKVSFPITLP